MKHTFVFIDKLMILLNYVPQISLDNETEKFKAKKTLVLIKEYSHILRKLIESHKTEENLYKLHHSHVHEIEDWVKHVEVTFKHMDVLLDEIDEGTEALADFIENGSDNLNAWQGIITDMSLDMLTSGLHGEEKHMLKLRKLAIFEIQELEKIIDHKQHFEGLFHWLGFAKLSPQEQMVEQEKYFTKLMS